MVFASTSASTKRNEKAALTTKLDESASERKTKRISLAGCSEFQDDAKCPTRTEVNDV